MDFFRLSKCDLLCSCCYGAVWGVAEFASKKFIQLDDHKKRNDCIECCKFCYICWGQMIGSAVALSLHIAVFPLVLIEGTLRLAFVLPFWLPCFFCFTLSRGLLYCNRNLHKPRWGIFFLVLYYPLFWMSLSFRWISKRIFKSRSCFSRCGCLEKWFTWWDGDGWYVCSLRVESPARFGRGFICAGVIH